MEKEYRNNKLTNFDEKNCKLINNTKCENNAIDCNALDNHIKCRYHVKQNTKINQKKIYYKDNKYFFDLVYFFNNYFDESIKINGLNNLNKLDKFKSDW